MAYKRSIVITGGAGFIGSHVVRLFVNKYPDYRIINVDKLTYAGNLANLKDIENMPNYRFVKMQEDLIQCPGIYILACQPDAVLSRYSFGNQKVKFTSVQFRTTCLSNSLIITQKG